MARGILARKLGMTQVFDESGNAVPVTVLQAGPCVVTQIRSADREGYDSLQLGFEARKLERFSKAERGHFEKRGLSTGYRHLREFRDAGLEVAVGDSVGPDIFEQGQRVKITGVSKGKGFQGVMKRHGHGGGRASHGSHFHRAPGSLGATSTPSRVFKNKKLPGHAGQSRSTRTSAFVVRVDAEQNLLLVRGSVPGPNTALVSVEALS